MGLQLDRAGVQEAGRQLGEGVDYMPQAAAKAHLGWPLSPFGVGKMRLSLSL
jgi:hypothetical protein